MSSKESSFLKSSYIEKKRKEIIKKLIIVASSMDHGNKQTMLNHTVFNSEYHVSITLSDFHKGFGPSAV